MVAKARQRFVDAVGRRREAYLIEKDAGEVVTAQELAKPPSGFLSGRWIVRAGKAEGLRDFASLLGPPSPTATALALPVHDEVGILHPVDIGEDAVPEEDVAHGPRRAAELAKDVRRFAKADEETIEVDRPAHPLDGLQHVRRIERGERRMRCRQLGPYRPISGHGVVYRMPGRMFQWPRRGNEELARSASPCPAAGRGAELSARCASEDGPDRSDGRPL